MNNTQVVNYPKFYQNELVTWHYNNGNGRQVIPIPAVVIRQELDSVIIRARIQGKIEELRVEPGQLDER